LLTAAATLFDGFSQFKIKIRFSEGKPNIEAREDIKITDTAPIVRAIEGEPDARDLVQRRWSWPGQNGLDVSSETVRRWVLKFEPLFVRELRRHRPHHGRTLDPAYRSQSQNAFAGSDGGGENWASLVESCKLCGVEPQVASPTCRRIVNGHLNRDIDDLLRWASIGPPLHQPYCLMLSMANLAASSKRAISTAGLNGRPDTTALTHST
jgi:hypothetical protein